MSTAKYLGSTMGDKNDVKIALLEQANDHVHETLQRIEKRFDIVDQRFYLIETKIDALEKKHETKLQKIEDKIDDHFKWTIGTIIGSVLIPVLLRIFHLM